MEFLKKKIAETHCVIFKFRSLSEISITAIYGRIENIKILVETLCVNFKFSSLSEVTL